MEILQKIPARTTAMLFAMIVLSITWIEVLAFIVFATVAGLAAFAFAMKFRAKYRDKRNTLIYKMVGIPLILADMYLNFTVCVIIFDQWFTPSEHGKIGWLVTDRLKWNKGYSTGYRFRIAYLLCKKLNKYDPGHC